MAVRRNATVFGSNLLYPAVSWNQVQLSETRRELQELKASLRVAQKEKEQLLAEKQVRDISDLSQQRVFRYVKKKKKSVCAVMATCFVTCSL